MLLEKVLIYFSEPTGSCIDATGQCSGKLEDDDLSYVVEDDLQCTLVLLRVILFGALLSCHVHRQ
jgi:hypothetical protein